MCNTLVLAGLQAQKLPLLTTTVKIQETKQRDSHYVWQRPSSESVVRTKTGAAVGASLLKIVEALFLPYRLLKKRKDEFALTQVIHFFVLSTHAPHG